MVVVDANRPHRVRLFRDRLGEQVEQFAERERLDEIRGSRFGGQRATRNDELSRFGCGRHPKETPLQPHQCVVDTSHAEVGNRLVLRMERLRKLPLSPTELDEVIAASIPGRRRHRESPRHGRSEWERMPSHSAATQNPSRGGIVVE